MQFFLCAPFLMLGCAAQPGETQAPATEELTFWTTDQVELVGTFYPSSKGAKGPCALLLHRIGGSREDPGWRDLAAALQQHGFAVLSFDFRGHGDSTAVSPEFWRLPSSRDIRGAALQSPKLSYEDFTRAGHYAALANDVAAAKHVLDLKSRDDECDSSTVVVIGAETGATVGALWLAAEWQRWRTTRDAARNLVKQGPEGMDVACAVWLSIRPHLQGRQTVPLETWLGTPVRERVPLGFVFGGRDARDSDYSTGLFDRLVQAGKDKQHPLTGIHGVDSSDKSGSKLLAESAEVRDLVCKYLDKVLKAHRRVVRAQPEAPPLPPIIAVEQFGVR